MLKSIVLTAFLTCSISAAPLPQQGELKRQVSAWKMRLFNPGPDKKELSPAFFWHSPSPEGDFRHKVSAAYLAPAKGAVYTRGGRLFESEAHRRATARREGQRKLSDLCHHEGIVKCEIRKLSPAAKRLFARQVRKIGLGLSVCAVASRKGEIIAAQGADFFAASDFAVVDSPLPAPCGYVRKIRDLKLKPEKKRRSPLDARS